MTTQEGIGGCIASNGKINLEGCIFSKNFVVYSAAALLNLGNATINNCRFEYLTTNYTAGAISNHNYTIINNSYFGYNDVKYYAAAILAPPSGQHVITKVYNTIFEQNHAGYHGAVTNNYKDTELFMQNCAIVGNYIVKDKIYGDIALDDNATVQYCWWGQNNISPYYYSPHDGNRNPEKINASRWLIMTFSSNTGVVYKNKDNTLTVDLNYYFDNETKETHKLNENINLPLEVTVYTNSQTITKKLVNGIATFNIKPASNENTVYAKINNQILEIDVDSRYSTLIAKDFTKDDIGEFKGFTIDKNHPIDFPFQNPYLLQYLTEKFDSIESILAEMRTIRCIEHDGRVKFVTPFVGPQVEICKVFGFEIPDSCAPQYVSRKKSATPKRGRPAAPKTTVQEF